MDPCDNIYTVCISPFLIVLACAVSAVIGWVMRKDEEEKKMIQQADSFVPYKQTDRSSCVACVAAMITRTTPEDFIRFVQELHPTERVGPPYSDIDLALYLLEFNIVMGAGAPQIRKVESGDLVAEIAFAINEYPAYVSVKSSENFEHALYWDGRQLWDPNPSSRDGMDPLSYTIVGWWPLIQLRGKQ